MSVPFFSSCDNDDPDPSCSYVTEVQDELQAVTDAGTAWGNDPTNVAKCNAYKAALQDYIDALEDHDNCVPGSQQDEYDQSLEDAQNSINPFQC